MRLSKRYIMKNKRLYPYLYCFFALFILLDAPAARAQNEAYAKGVFITQQHDSMPYRLLAPQSLKSGKKYPLVLFLHGAGERGSDNESQLRNGGTVFTNPVAREQYPCFVLFPQLGVKDYWSLAKRPAQGYKGANPMPKEVPITKHLQAVKALLDKVNAENPVDESSIYIIGISMGAIATYDMVYRFPDRFAAAVAICGATNIARMQELGGKTAFRLYHGDIDDVIPVRYSREAYEALHRKGRKVEYIEVYGAGHNAWHPAFNRPDFLSWLFKQKR